MMFGKKVIREKTTMPYNERIRHYAYEKNQVLEMCNTQEEIDRALYLLRKKWRV